MLADPQVEAVIVAIADQFHVAACDAGDRGRQACPGREAARRDDRGVRGAARGAGLGPGRPGRQQPPVRPGIAYAGRFMREEMGGVMALKAWYCDSTYRYTMTDNLQPIPVQRQRPQAGPRGTRRPTSGDTSC